MKTAFIIGASGQTGAYLSRLLLAAEYRVIGTSRNWAESQTWRLARLGVLDDVTRLSLSLHDSLALEEALDSAAPDEIYYLAGPSSVAASFREPTIAMSEIFDPVVSLLEILKRRSSTAHFVNAASTDCFGNHGKTVLDEQSSMKPVSPYGIAKTATYLTTQNYREAFGLNASNAILTNHESPLRGPDFVTQKIISGLRAIRDGRESNLALGNTTIARDWLWADDVAHALHAIGSAQGSSDYVVASGTT
ncbi:GDP-mannose 4,6-dehydratase, partial [Pontimonas sp.]|nr:GDP-mannose 4,6-dehydratase [Pontimonas sp.]